MTQFESEDFARFCEGNTHTPLRPSYYRHVSHRHISSLLTQFLLHVQHKEVEPITRLFLLAHSDSKSLQAEEVTGRRNQDHRFFYGARAGGGVMPRPSHV